MRLLYLILISLFFVSAGFSQFDAKECPLSILTIIAAVEGHMEWRNYNNGYRGTGPKIFGWLRANYHPFVGIRWATFCVLLNEPEFFPLFTVIEDIAFQISDRTWPDKYSWISRLGGVKIGGLYIPAAYLIGVGLTIILYQVF